MGIRLALSGYIGFVVYCTLSLLLGPMGLRAYSELEARAGYMRENLSSLESTNNSARARMESMQSDPEVLTLEARSLGYVREGEVVVRLGFPEGPVFTRDPGTLIPFLVPQGIPDSKLKTIAIVSALFAFFSSLLVRRVRVTEAGRMRRGMNGARSAPRTGSV